jgi:hypothetical protein
MQDATNEKKYIREETFSVASRVLGVQHLVSRLTNVLRSRVSSMWWQRMVGSTLLRAAAPMLPATLPLPDREIGT